jgi:cytochrome c oxidase subunit 4
MAKPPTGGFEQSIPPPNWRQLIGGPAVVWLVLLFLLAASGGSAFVPLGSYNVAVNLLIAAIMLFLLATFLMNLKEANMLLRLVAAAGLFWVIFLFALTFTDYLSRRSTEPPPPRPSAALKLGTAQQPLDRQGTNP